MQKTLRAFFSISLFVIFLTSCKNLSKIYYFNNLKPSVQNLDSLKDFGIQRIKSNDRISIIIGSTDPALTAYLNPITSLNASSSNSNSNSNLGYLVNSDGDIEFPLLGKVPVIGLTTTEIATLIKTKLAYYYKDLFVNVNLNGRVYFTNGRQGNFIQMTNERLTVFEAITQFANQDPFDIKSKLWLIREDSGKRYFTQLDLNDKKIFESPYYYLKSNDLLYVRPNKLYFFNSPSSPYRIIVTSIVTLFGVIIAFKNL